MMTPEHWQHVQDLFHQALDLAQLYEAWGKPEKVAPWREQRRNIEAKQQNGK